MNETNVGTFTDKNDRPIMHGDVFVYNDTQWIAMYNDKTEEWIGHPVGSNLAAYDILLSHVHNEVEVYSEE